MKFIDTHAHLNFKAFADDFDEVIKRSFAEGIEKIIVVGSQFTTSKRAIKLAEEYENIYAAIGIHPIHASFSDFEKLKKIVNHPKVVAIGETGLDYYSSELRAQSSKLDKDKQKELFKMQLELASELDLPVIIHSREADDDVLKQLKIASKELPKRGVVHCFLGSLEFAKRVLDLGFLIGFTSIITYPKTSELRKVVEKVPLEKILIETDSPYLAPQAYRGQRCEPWHVKEVAKKIAEIKGISLKEVAKTTTQNAQKLFKI